MSQMSKTMISLWKKQKWLILIGTSLLLLIGAVFIPLPYYIEMPGGAYDIREVLEVNHKSDEEEGTYQFVAITQMRATAAGLLYAYLTPYTEVTTQEETLGDISDEDYYRINQFYMETSKNTAIYQALTLAGKKAELDYKGVYVLELAANSTFKDILHLADTVTGVNGQTFKSSKELIAFVADLDLGSDVTVQYLSDGQKKEGKGKIIQLKNGKNGIGIGLVDHTEVATQETITFDTTGVGGPSAGLMFTLAIYDQLTAEDLRQGRTIAGTGTIEMDGTVGEIGGIDKKVVSADQAGASVFFAPAGDNYDDAVKTAKELGTDMAIVKVDKVQDALDYLRQTKS